MTGPDDRRAAGPEGLNRCRMNTNRAGGLTAALIATTTAQALTTFTVFLLPVLAPLAARDLGVAPHWVGYQVALTYVAASTTSALSPAALRRWGPARCTQVALAGAAFACFAVVLLGLAGAVLGALATGLGYGLTNPAASQVLARLAPAERRNMVFAVKQTGVPIGGAAAGLLLPSLALAIGWRGAALAAGGVLLLAALGCGVFRRHWDDEREPGLPLRAGTGGGFRALREQPGLAGLAMIGALYAGFQLALGTYAVTMLVEEFRWSPVAAGAAAAAVQAVGAAGRIAWGVVADRWHGMATLGLIGLVTALAGLVLPLAHGWPEAAVTLLLCALGGSAAAWNGVLMAESARLAAPGRVADAAGGVLAICFAGVVVGPVVFALVVAFIGTYATAFAALALLPVAGAVIAWRTLGAERRRLLSAPLRG